MPNFTDVRFVMGAARWEGLPTDGLPEVAFIGRSNVGKSSLLNRLVGRKQLARTSSTPGKTQQFNFYRVEEPALYLVDVPGFGYAKVAQAERVRWQRFIGRYLTERPTLRLVFHLIDSRHPPTALDQEVLLLMKDSPAVGVILLTKADKLSGNRRIQSVKQTEAALHSLGLERAVLLTSATDGRGRDEILQWIETIVIAREN
jgi:GTP-binding protein